MSNVGKVAIYSRWTGFDYGEIAKETAKQLRVYEYNWHGEKSVNLSYVSSVDVVAIVDDPATAKERLSAGKKARNFHSETRLVAAKRAYDAAVKAMRDAELAALRGESTP